MYPHERSLVKKMEGKPFALIGINSDKDREELKKTLVEEKITWRSFWNGGSTKGPISDAWNVRGWPTLYVIDHHGIIRARFLGSPSPEVLDSVIEELVKKAESR